MLIGNDCYTSVANEIEVRGTRFFIIKICIQVMHAKEGRSK